MLKQQRIDNSSGDDSISDTMDSNSDDNSSEKDRDSNWLQIIFVIIMILKSIIYI